MRIFLTCFLIFIPILVVMWSSSLFLGSNFEFFSIPLGFGAFFFIIILFVVIGNSARSIDIYSSNNTLIGIIKSNFRGKIWTFRNFNENSEIIIKFDKKTGTILIGDEKFIFSEESKKGRKSMFFFGGGMFKKFLVENNLSGNRFYLDYANKLTSRFEIILEGKVDPLMIFVFSTTIIQKHFIKPSESSGGGG